MVQDIITALIIMGQGMLGIFTAILIIMVVIIVIQKFSVHRHKPQDIE